MTNRKFKKVTIKKNWFLMQ